MMLLGRLTTVVAVMVMVAKVQQAQTARILMAVPIGTRSHNNFFMPLAENLGQRNHTVTYITGYEPPKRPPNVTVVFVPGVQIFERMANPFTSNVHITLSSMANDMKTACIDALGYKEVQKLRNEKFDLLILHIGITECFLTFAYELQIPFIFVNQNRMLGQQVYATGSPYFPSLSTSFLLDLEYPLTFMSRLISTLYDIMGIVYNERIMLPSQEAACLTRNLCPRDMPKLSKMVMNSSLVIMNSVRTMENPTLPYTPTVVHAGGIQCRPAKPLPEDLQQWVAGAGKPGIILFSLGSLIKSSTMPQKYRNVLLEVFGSLQQRVLWKWDEDTIEGLPSNVRVFKWLPQQDILGHPQMRLFITHGGLFSSQEATYHGVPVLGLPVTLDQHHNMRTVEREGWGRVLQWENLTYDTFLGLTLQIMDDSRLMEQVRWRARVMRDQPMSPGDWASYWVEYVLRHQGARHLRSPALHMPWYQLYNADVWAVVVMVTLMAASLIFWFSNRILRALVGFCCRSRKIKKD